MTYGGDSAYDVGGNRMRHSIRSDTPNASKSNNRLRWPRGGILPDAQDDKREKAFLVGVLLPNSRVDWSDPLGELAALAESSGTEVCDSLVQKRPALSPGYALGKGKLAELVERAEASEIDVVIFDNALSPRQIRNLEKALERKVIDRSELILDIFACRAVTREARMQVELAQLQYTAPRLRGMWTHLERIAGAGGATAAGAVGGVGTRGPGERQIEIDRRIVRERIRHLQREIDQIDRRKQQEVDTRSDRFSVSLVGYTNSGKSTLMNRLTGAECFCADQLFATLDTKTIRWDLGERTSALLSDTVGFVRDLPHHLVASFRATLEETVHADLLLHVVDISSPQAWQQVEAVEAVLAELNCGDVPQIYVLNKVDVADDMSMAEMLTCHRPSSVSISALTGAGIDKLLDEVRQRARHDRCDVTLQVPHSEGKLLSEIDRLAEVRDREYGADNVQIKANISRAHLLQLTGRYKRLVVTDGPDDLFGDTDEAQ